MKSILISVRPKWVEKIARGEKTIEVRKTAPKGIPFKAYIYCTEEKKQDDIIWAGAFGDRGKWNGHIIGEFICDKVYNLIDAFGGIMFEDENLNQLEPQLFRNMSCLTDEQTADYLGNKDGYGWHISDLKIYDKPKELSEYWGRIKWLSEHTVECWNCFAKCVERNGNHYQPITRPPQSWQYVEEIIK